MVYEKIAEILSEILDIDLEDISLDMGLTRECDVLDIHIAGLVIQCEKAFKIPIWDEEVYRFLKVKDIVNYVEGAILEHKGNTQEITDEDRTAWYY